jgi:hypothetical protein
VVHDRRTQSDKLQKNVVARKWQPEIENYPGRRRHEGCDKVPRIKDALNHAFGVCFGVCPFLRDPS